MFLSSFVVTHNALLAVTKIPNSFDTAVPSAQSYHSFTSGIVGHLIKLKIQPSSTPQLQPHPIIHKATIFVDLLPSELAFLPGLWLS